MIKQQYTAPIGKYSEDSKTTKCFIKNGFKDLIYEISVKMLRSLFVIWMQPFR